LITTLELAGYSDDSMTLQILLFAGAALVGLFALAWAAGAARKMLLLYGTGLLTLIATEAGLRLNPALDSPVWTMGGHNSLFRFDAKLGWRFIPNAEEVVEVKGEYRTTVKINSEGFRDPEPDGQTSARMVAVLGDSFVSNLGVKDEELFTALIRRQLGPGLSVRNYGVNGYGQVQELFLLDEILASRQPVAALVVVYTRNDFDDNLGEFDWVLGYKRPLCRLKDDGQIELVSPPRPPKPSPNPDSTKRRWSLEQTIHKTRMYRLLRQTLQRAFPQLQPVHERAPELGYCKRVLEPREQKAVEITQALLYEMKRRCDQHQCRFGVVLAPSLWQVQQPQWDGLLADNWMDARDYDRTMPNQLLAAYCKKQRFPCLDLLPLLEARAGTGENLYYLKEQHWNALGQKRVADAIAAWLRQLSLGAQAASLGAEKEDSSPFRVGW
jgi:hypothetical protein